MNTLTSASRCGTTLSFSVDASGQWQQQQQQRKNRRESHSHNVVFHLSPSDFRHSRTSFFSRFSFLFFGILFWFCSSSLRCARLTFFGVASSTMTMTMPSHKIQWLLHRPKYQRKPKWIDEIVDDETCSEIQLSDNKITNIIDIITAGMCTHHHTRAHKLTQFCCDEEIMHVFCHSFGYFLFVLTA